MSLTAWPNHMTRRRGLAARCVTTLGVVCLVLGVPLVMMAIHAQPPLDQIRSVTGHPEELRRMFGERVSDRTITEIVAGVAWLVWAWFVVCVIAELIGRARGRTASRVPGSRHLQSLVAGLLGASLLVGVSGRQALPLRLRIAATSVSAPYIEPPTQLPRHLKRLETPNVVEADAGTPNTIAALAPASPERIYVVKPRDTLWSISEVELGSPLEWRRIAEANYGRHQPDGGELTDDHWIRPGWLLVIPMPGSSVAEPPPAPPFAAVDPPTSETGSARADVPAPEGGAHRSLPARVTSAPPIDVSGSMSATNGFHETRRSLSSDSQLRAGGGEAPGSQVPVAPIGYGLLGAGIVALLDRMRRVQQRRREAGLRIVLPDGDLVELERGLRLAADPGAVDWVDLALRLLAVTVRRDHRETPTVSAVVLREDAVEIMLERGGEPSSPPPPFEPGDRGQSWLLAKTGQRIEVLRRDPEVVGVDAPLPALVTLGRDALGIVLINIEQAGSVAIFGPEADLLAEAIAVELATTRWGDQIDLMLVGFDGDISGLERVSHVRSLESVRTKVQRRTRERAALLTLAQRTTTSDTRWQDGGDAWDLCVVICSARACADDPSLVAEIIEIAGDGSLGVAVICANDAQLARWRVRAEDGRVAVDGWPMEWAPLARQPVPSNLVTRVAELVSIAAKTEGVLPSDAAREPRGAQSEQWEPTGKGQTDVAGQSMKSGVVGPDQPEVLVKVLGRVEIIGAAREFTRAWAVELVVYLAVHRGGASNEQWATALWPDKVMAPASLHSTASAARRCLGASQVGDDHLPRSRGRLALGPGVETDWDSFLYLSRSPLADDWRRAIELVRGRPFDGIRSPDWVVLEGIQAEIESGVVDLVHRYGHHCLEALDAAGAEWAARQGLRVSPYDERLYRILMSAADVAGNPAGVESVMAELVRVVSDDIEPFDAVHPDTMTLYRTLSRRSLAPRGR